MNDHDCSDARHADGGAGAGPRWCRPCLVALLAFNGAVAAAPGRFIAGGFPFLADEVAITDIAIGSLRAPGSRDFYIVFANVPQVGGGSPPLTDRIFYNQGGKWFESGWTLDAPAQAGVAVVLADFDGDGRVDAAVAGGAIDNVAAPTEIYRNPASIGATRGVVGPVVASRAIAAGDMDGDGDPDLAIARASGTVDILRNNGQPFDFTVVQTLQVATTAAGELAFGHFTGGTRPDLVVLRPANDPLGEPSGVLLFPATGSTTPFGAPTFTVIPAIQLADLAAGALDSDAFDDVVVAAITELGDDFGASRILRGSSAGLALDPFRFPVEQHTAVAVGDLDGTGTVDIVFARRRESGGSLDVWLQRPGGFVSSAQCVGEHAPSPRALDVALIDGDALADIAVAGFRNDAAPFEGTGWWRNDAPATSNLCCLVEAAANFGGAAEDPAPGRDVAPDFVSRVDIAAFAAVRDELMATALNGPRLRQRFLDSSAEIVAAMVADASLWTDAARVLTLWSDPVRALVDGQGTQATVSPEMIQSVDAFLQRLSSEGSASLAAAIAAERAAAPPFATLVGLDMDEFRQLVLPIDIGFADGFESPTGQPGSQ